MESDATRAHYERLADRFDENWDYSPEFVSWMTENLIKRLNLTPGKSRLLDVGSGTGLYARGMVEHTAVAVCTDLSPAMLEQLPTDDRLVPLVASAEDLAAGLVRPPGDGYNAILMKEVVHHLGDPEQVLVGLSRLLRPGGRILVAMLPSTIDYPLFSAALDLFRERQPSPDSIAAAMNRAGLQTELTYDEFPLIFTVERYTQMVRNRYMSLLASFNDAELEAGVSEIRRKHPGPEVRFPDRFAFVLGVKA
ncbi:class I SAM-dependent methyltransferase [Nonomuraea sp. NPDC046802]|uniref:class I SAM-dependent methyltransferase n=1 Tax=Nonomuraea sp. NPDC046802 TaxID=3154919 RepID=UPI0033ED716F